MNVRANVTSHASKMPVWERALRLCLNLFLLLLLALQCWGISILSQEKEIPVPAFLMEGVKKQLDKQDIELLAQNVHFDLRGRLFFTNAQLLHKPSQHLIARCDKLLVDISLVRLLLGTIRLNQLSLRNGVLLCPAPYSPSGLSEALLNDARIDLVRRADAWHIQRAVGRIRGSLVRFEGLLPKTTPAFETDRQSTIGQTYLLAAKRAIAQIPHLDSVQNPIVYGHIQKDNNALISLSATLAGESLTRDHSIYAQRPVFQISYMPFQPRHPIRFKASFTDFTAHDYSTSIDNARITAYALPNLKTFSRASFYAENITSYNKTISDCSGEFDIRDFPFISGELTLTFGDTDSYATVHGEAHLLSRNARLEVETEARLGDIATLIPTDHFQHSNAQLNATGTLDIDNASPTLASFNTQLQHLTIDHLTLPLITSQGQWTPDSLDLSLIEVTTANWNLRGQYLRNLKSNYDQLYLQGNLNPHDLTPWMESWWEKLWENFVFSENFMNLNLEMRDFLHKSEPGFLFARLDGNDFTFRNVPIHSCSATVRMIPDYIEIFDLKPRGPSGYADVNLEWVYRPDYESRYLVRFDARGRLPLPHVDAISGGEITEVLDIVKPEHTPRLAVRGTVFGDTTPLAGRKHIDVTAYAPGIVHAFELPIEELTLEAFARPDLLRLEKLNYTLADANGTGRVELHHKDEHILLDLALVEANSRKLFSYLPLITKDDSNSINESNGTNKLIDADGKTDFSLLAEGKRGKLETFSGEGRLHLYEAELGQLYMLGGLSRLLAITPLKVGTFSFNEALIPFSLNDGILKSNTISVDGPSARLEAFGSLDLIEDDLDLTVRLLMSKNLSTPIIGQALRLLDPVSSSFIFNVSGHPENPEWQIAVNPFSQQFGNEEEDEP